MNPEAQPVNRKYKGERPSVCMRESMRERMEREWCESDWNNTKLHTQHDCRLYVEEHEKLYD